MLGKCAYETNTSFVKAIRYNNMKSTLDMVKKNVNMYGNDLSDRFEQYSAL